MSSNPTPRPAGEQPAASSRGMVLLAVLVGALAAGVYVVLRQSTSHEFDIYWMLPQLQRGELDYPRHPLGLHVFQAWNIALQWLGGSLHDRLRIASGLSSGIAVAVFTHAAWLLTRNRGVAVWIGITYACLPAVSYFARMMELHAQFLPVAAIAIWLACWVRSAPDRLHAGSCIALGGATTLASGMHGSGHFLVGFLGLWLALELWSRGHRSRVAVWLAGFVAVHALGNVLLRLWLLPASAPVSVADQIELLAAPRPTLRGLPDVVLGEWIVPFFPVSLLWVLAFAAAPRKLAWSLLLSLVAYLAVCQFLLVLPSVGYTLHERGAYQLPIAFAAVVLTAQQLGRRLRLATLLLALAGSVTVWCNPVKDSADLGFGQVALDYLRTHPVRLFVSCFAELDGVFDVAQADPDYGPHWRSVMSVPQIVFESERAGGRSAIELALFFHPSVAGATVITAKALDQLRQHGGVYAELVDVTLPSIYALREVNETGTNGHTLHAFRLDPK